ncbi:MAG: heparinase II/III family protein [Tepidisphaeraceae bacterium]|jgi:hypothetical protein
MKHVISFLLVSVVFCVPLRAQEDVLKSLQKEHPRIFIRKADLGEFRQRVKSDPQMAAWYAGVKASAEKILKEPPVEHVLIGPRLLDKSRRALERMLALGTVYLVDGDTRMAERAKKEMLAIAEFADWNPPHFLDTAEMTNAFGVGYDWFYPALSEAERKAIRAAIVEKGLKPGLVGFEKKAFWTKVTHNWAQVCNGGLSVGALAIGDTDPQIAAEIVGKCRGAFEHSMETFVPDGGFPEGPGYWGYATLYTAFYLSATESALGTDFGNYAKPGFRETGLFRIHCAGPSGMSFNYADAGAGTGSAPQMMLLARAFGIAAYREHQAAFADARPHPLNLIWGSTFPWQRQPAADAKLAHIAQLPLDAFFKGVNVAFFRSAWNDPGALWVGIKGGDNKANHSHLDLGSFVLDAQGQRWAHDLGGDDYNLPAYFGNKRWTYYRLRTESHNTLLLDGENQDPSAQAPMMTFYSGKDRSHCVIDLSAAWKGRASRVTRGLAMLNRSVIVVQDEVEAAKPVEVAWSFVTAARIDTSGRQATLSIKGKTMHVRILAPESAKFEVLSCNPPPPQKQQSEMHNLSIQLGKITEARLVVVISAEEKAAAGEIRPLAAWQR